MHTRHCTCISFYLILAFVFMPGYCLAVAAEKLSLEEVLASSLSQFPRIQSAMQESIARRGRVTSALGAFDLALEQESLVWASGFYDGASVDTRFVKPLPSMNAKVYSGYRLSNDDFPIYQQELVTNDAGEFNAGVVFSLWRDRAVDARRMTVNNARLDVRTADVEVTLAKLITQRNASLAFWKWLATGRRLAVYQDLVALAEGRIDGLEKRVAEGDVAKIFVLENEQNLLRRQSLMTAAERDFIDARINLSLYLRNEEGAPRQPIAAELPDIFPAIVGPEIEPTDLVTQVLERRPEFALLNIDQKRQRNELQLAENLLMPRVDVGVKTAHDIGGGSASRRGFDAIVDLTVSIPLERRRAKGLSAAARAKIHQLEIDKRFERERLTNELFKLGNAIDKAHRFAKLAEKESEQASYLEKAERQRFEAGASDFFLVNLREERSADARLRYLDAQLRYYTSLTDYHAISVDFTALGM